MEASVGEYIKNYLHLRSFPRISLHCKLGQVQYYWTNMVYCWWHYRVCGKGETDHDQHILNKLDRARENIGKFNAEKFQLKIEEKSLFGLTWTTEGLKPDDKNVKCIVDMQPRQNLTELKSFMGMIDYLNRSSLVIAQISDPLH